MTLVEFLRARLDEDAAPVPHDAWHADWCLAPEVPPGWDQCFYCGEKVDPERVEHVLRSKRVLAEADAKRRIVELYEQRDAEGERNPVFGHHATGLLLAIKALAAVYADHPDYDESWRP